jgi:signal transduction histidine kinase/ActR/RegA family two-component response regulator
VIILARLQALRSFGAKVVWIVTVVSGVAVAMVSGAAGVRSYFALRDQLDETIAAQASIVAMNSSAPLAFGDEESAREAVQAFSVSRAVFDVQLLDLKGRLFARYRPNESIESAPSLKREPGLTTDGAHPVLAVPVTDRSGEYGQLQVHYTNQPATEQAWWSLLETLLLSLGAMAVAFLLAQRIKGVLVGPVRELDRTAAAVAQSNDYSLRARKFSDDELGRFTDRFNAMLGEIETSTRQREAAHREAEEASRLKDEFVATLSHELRTPMAPILGWSQILQAKVRDDPELKRGAAVIERNARTLIGIINDLLDMSRIVSGNLRLEVRQIHLNEPIGEALETVAAAAEAKGVAMSLRLDPGVGTVRGDPARLKQVVWNLLANAIKFTPAGGTVEVSLTRVGEHAQLSVTDTGVGMEPSFLPFVFDRFRQADGTTTREHSGLGLGLAIVKQLVELHGGTVEASSPGPGQGARFTVRLPTSSESIHSASRRRAPMAEPATIRAQRPLEGMRVLVVEDQADTRDLLEQSIRGAGATVHAASSSEEAFRAFERHLPDVVVSDIGLPGEDGYALIRRIRARSAEAGGQVPAIALTAFAHSDDRTRALRAGFQLHLAKPVEPEELVASLRSVRR